MAPKKGGISNDFEYFSFLFVVVSSSYSKVVPGKRLEFSWRERGVSEMLSWTLFC